MLSLTFDPLPILSIDGELVYGINIIERLYQLMETSEEAKKLFLQIASAHQYTQYPSIGFRLNSSDAVMPTKRISDVGYDLTIISIVKQISAMTTLFDSKVSLDIPLGYYVEIHPRSSISKTGYMLSNSCGIIDPNYKGNLLVALTKIDPSMPDLTLPVRIAQIILKPYVISNPYDASKYEKIQTNRGDGGFGSTG